MRLTRSRFVIALSGIALLALGSSLWWTKDRVGLERLGTIQLPGRGLRAALSTEAGKAGILTWKDALICDAVTGKVLLSLKNPVGHSLGWIAISNSANKFAVTDAQGALNVFDLTDSSPLWSAEVTRLQFSDVRFFPSGTRIAVSDGIWHEPGVNRGAIRIYDAKDGSLQSTVGKLPHSPMQLAISPDERWLCARLNYGGQVFIWSLTDLAEIRRFGFCPEARGYVKDPGATSLDISHDSAFVSVGGEGAFGVWRLSSGEQLLAVAAAEQTFTVRFHPSESTLCVITSDAIQSWNYEKEQFVQRSTTPVRLKERNYTFADDAPILCILDDKSLMRYRLPTQKP